MAILHTREAFVFYQRFIRNERLQRLFREYNLHVIGSVPSKYWELFGAILTGDLGRQGYGSDLNSHEIKSAKDGGNFEYQYHKKAGQQKLKEDMEVDHVFISYDQDYQDVDVRILSGKELAKIFQSWLPELIKNYAGPNPAQRFRRSIQYSFVKGEGKLVMRVRNGKLIDDSAVR